MKNHPKIQLTLLTRSAVINTHTLNVRSLRAPGALWGLRRLQRKRGGRELRERVCERAEIDRRQIDTYHLI